MKQVQTDHKVAPDRQSKDRKMTTVQCPDRHEPEVCNFRGKVKSMDPDNVK